MAELNQNDDELLDLSKPPPLPDKKIAPAEPETDPFEPPPPRRRFRDQISGGGQHPLRDVTGTDSFVDEADSDSIHEIPAPGSVGKKRLQIGTEYRGESRSTDWMRSPITALLVAIVLVAIFWRSWILPLAQIAIDSFHHGDYGGGFFLLMLLWVPLNMYLRFRRSADYPSWDDDSYYTYDPMLGYSGGQGCGWWW